MLVDSQIIHQQYVIPYLGGTTNTIFQKWVSTLLTTPLVDSECIVSGVRVIINKNVHKQKYILPWPWHIFLNPGTKHEPA